MQTVIQKWGNSLGIRIPSTYVKGLHLKNGANVDIKEENGKLIIEPTKKMKLQQLLDGITADNIHEPVETGASVGKEEW